MYLLIHIFESLFIYLFFSPRHLGLGNVKYVSPILSQCTPYFLEGAISHAFVLPPSFPSCHISKHYAFLISVGISFSFLFLFLLPCSTNFFSFFSFVHTTLFYQFLVCYPCSFSFFALPISLITAFSLFFFSLL